MSNRLMTKQKDCLVAAEFSSTGVTTEEGRGREHEQETKLRILWVVDSQSDPRRGTLKTVSLTTDPQNSSPRLQDHANGRKHPVATVRGTTHHFSLGNHQEPVWVYTSTWMEPGTAGPQAPPGQSELIKLHLINFFSLCCLASLP